jgi:T5orf172 domain
LELNLASKRSSNGPTAVYLFRNVWAEANYKIGIASIIDRRKWQIVEAYQVAPILVTAVWFPSRTAAKEAEKRWHQWFKDAWTDDHSGKEWFSLTDSQLKEFVTWAKYSPDEALLKLKHKSGLLTNDEAYSLTRNLLNSIPTHRPYGRRKRVRPA